MSLCTNPRCSKILGLSINICSIVVGLLTIIAGTSLWGFSSLVTLNLFMLSSGIFVIATELFYFPRLMMYVKSHQTLWGRSIFFTFLGMLSHYNGDALHITCMILIFCVVCFLIIYGLIASLWLKISFGVPPPLIGFPKTEQNEKYQAGGP